MTTQIVLATRQDGQLAELCAGTTPTALSLPEGLEYEQWEQVGTMLRRLGAAWQFWAGDWLRYGEHTYGEKYSQAVAITDHDEKTLRNCAWVAGRIEPSRRRDTLSWSHHAEVAVLDPDEQDALLTAAEQGSWPRAQLREAVRVYQREKRAASGEATPEGLTCEACGSADLAAIRSLGEERWEQVGAAWVRTMPAEARVTSLECTACGMITEDGDDACRTAGRRIAEQ